MAAPNGDPLVTVNKIGRGEVILVALPDLLGEDERITPFAAHLIAHLAADATPIRVEGDVEYLVNRNSRGWVVTLFNDNGVFKPQQGMATVDRSATVGIRMTLTAPACPAAQSLPGEVQRRIAQVPGVADVKVDIVWDPPWDRERMSDAARLQLGLF